MLWTLIQVTVALVGLVVALWVVLRPIELLGEWLDDRMQHGMAIVCIGLWLTLNVGLPLGLWLGLR